MAPLFIGLGVFGGVLLLGVLFVLVKNQSGGKASRPDNQRLTANHLKQLGVAIRNYHEVYEVYPPGGIYDIQGRGHHGWQTALLPQMDQGPLYDRINFDVPWDDPKNIPHFQHELEAYCRASDEPRKDAAGLGLSHWAANKHMMYRNSSLRLRDFWDGPSNTIMAGEVVGNFKPWGYPTNWRDPAAGINQGASTFGNPHRKSGLFLMGDGSVREISENVLHQTLYRLSTVNRLASSEAVLFATLVTFSLS